MSEKKRSYPLRSLHDFLTELDKEWERFRMGAVIGIVTSGLLVVFLIVRLLILIARIRAIGLRLIGTLDFLQELSFFAIVSIFVFYEIYLLFRQYRFFTRWERRVGLLIHIEERLIGETEEGSD